MRKNLPLRTVKERNIAYRNGGESTSAAGTGGLVALRLSRNSRLHARAPRSTGESLIL